MKLGFCPSHKGDDTKRRGRALFETANLPFACGSRPPCQGVGKGAR
jgi:hypothetical protein